MKAPLEWLKEFVDIKISAKEFGNKMTISGSKVEEIIVSGEDIQKVYTGKIIDFKKHENSDHLNVCQVDLGQESLGGVLQIVCGAPNVKIGGICPVAIHGAKLPGDFSIKKGKIRGEVSEGMCCSIDELAFTLEDFPQASEDGLWYLPEGTPLGVDIKEILGLGEVTIDFEITSNRPDCFCIEGLAREAAATLHQEFKVLNPIVKGLNEKISQEQVKIAIEEPDLCYRYCGRVVENVVIEPSPDWMQKRLKAAGMRPINNIVDITNYVCIELGQPMHAFDLNYLEGRTITVRLAKEAELVQTLDEKDRKLDKNILVIADEKKVCAVAGVMGALNSEVNPKTQSILFESATFNPVSVRATAQKLGLRTEASSRYEKGLDPENTKRALDRACQLVELLACGTVCQGMIDVYPTPKKQVEILFRPDKINAFLGIDLSLPAMIDILEKLEIKSVKKMEKIFCQIPSFRPDLVVEADLAEEIARFYDYNKIQPTLLSGKATTLGGRNFGQKIVEKINDVMVAQGYFEAITYSFESPKELDKLLIDKEDILRQQVKISNPLGEDFSVMRTTLAPSLLRVAGLNYSRSIKNGKIFEIAYAYLPNKDSSLLPQEIQMLEAVLFDTQSDYKAADLFFKAKGLLEELSGVLGIKNCQIDRENNLPYLHLGRRGNVVMNNISVGYVGYIAPEICANFNVPPSLVLFSLDIAKIIELANLQRRFTSLPKFPSTSRDIAIILDKDTPVLEIEKIIKTQGGKYLESYQLFDVYTGDQIQSNKKSVAYNLVFRSGERTLTEEDVVPFYDKILQKLEEKLNAKLR